MLCIEDMSIVRGSGEQAHRVCLPALTLPLGQVVAVTGESGCGKSTLLEVIGLLLSPSRVGRFEMDFIDAAPAVVDIAHLLAANDQAALADIRAARIGFMLQSGGLLPFLKVRGKAADGGDLYDQGPSNWARLRNMTQRTWALSSLSEK